jgi:hypothetical protein
MIDTIRSVIIPGAYTLLPKAMASAPATALLLAIGLQESRFIHRRQMNGPARGFWQFESAGVEGVLRHDGSSAAIRKVLETLMYPGPHEAVTIQARLEHNDLLAAAFARCLLWTVPFAMPKRDDPESAWSIYRVAWRPGKPHRDTWDRLYAEAWDRVEFSTPAPAPILADVTKKMLDRV